MRTVRELCPDVNSTRLTVEYLRSKCDPRVVMDTRSGECFMREGGENWEHPAYAINRFDITAAWEKPQPKGAYCDDVIYAPKARAAA